MGKTLLATPKPTILPALTPFRPPLHSVNDADWSASETTPHADAISIVHKGVLLLDEMPEINRKTLEVLRPPLEKGEIMISRALRGTTFSAHPGSDDEPVPMPVSFMFSNRSSNVTVTYFKNADAVLFSENCKVL